jgi:hypothetical protein
MGERERIERRGSSEDDTWNHMGTTIFLFFFCKRYVDHMSFIIIIIIIWIELLHKRRVNAMCDECLVKGATSAKTEYNTAKEPHLHWL